MIIVTRVGTANHLEERRHDSGPKAKKHLRNQINKNLEWARRYSQACAGELASASQEIDGTDITMLKVGDTRRWTAWDDVTNVTFVFDLMKESK